LARYADAAAINKGEEVTLMDLGNAIVEEIKMESGVITELVGELRLEGSVKTTKLKITWLADVEELVPLTHWLNSIISSTRKKVISAFFTHCLYMFCTSGARLKDIISCMIAHVS
jgi:hypothetical protein